MTQMKKEIHYMLWYRFYKERKIKIFSKKTKKRFVAEIKVCIDLNI